MQREIELANSLDKVIEDRIAKISNEDDDSLAP